MSTVQFINVYSGEVRIETMRTQKTLCQSRAFAREKE